MITIATGANLKADSTQMPRDVGQVMTQVLVAEFITSN
jgi:hypothetical protein